MSTCIACGHPVGKGKGNKHAKGQCPPPKGIRKGRRYEKAQAAKRTRKRAKKSLIPERGVAIVGTGKPSASSKA